MKEMRIIDYIIEQADRNDAKNLQFEQDILGQIDRLQGTTFSKAVLHSTGFSTLLEMQKLLTILDRYIDDYTRSIKLVLLDMFTKYENTAYNNMSQLIEVGEDVEKRYLSIISEMQNRDKDTIRYIETHAFELLTGYTNGIKNRLRAAFGDLLLRKDSSRIAVQKMVQKILGVTPSKAKEIAQTELSRAYNYGVIARLSDYQRETGKRVRKYWYGFQYSPVTCPYCRERIGNIYDINDDSETLPAHVRCRCVWLPMLDGWDKPVSMQLISKANMLSTVYSEDQMYDRINNRLGINYSKYMDVDDVEKYLSGDRTPGVMSKISIARDRAVDNQKSSFDIAAETSNDLWSKKFNTQMSFWKETIAEAIVDNNIDLLNKSYEALKGVISLPWNSKQLDKWNTLIDYVGKAHK